MRRSAVLLILAGAIGLESANARKANFPQFKVLCELYRVSRWPKDREKQGGQLNRDQAHRAILDIQKLVVATAPRGGERELAERLNNSEPNWEKVEIINESGKLTKRFPQIGVEGNLWKLASGRIRSTLRKAEGFFEQQGKIHTERNSAEGLVERELNKALSGNDQGTIDDNSFAGEAGTTTRQNSCSHNAGAANGRRPGFSIVNDVYCLCGGKHSAVSPAGSDACGASAVEEAKWQTDGGDDSKLPADVGTNFPKVMQNCGPDYQSQKERPTPEAISNALADFDSLLGKSAAADHASRRFLFGAGGSNSDGVCTGTGNNDNCVCVNYVTALTGEAAPGILWRKAMRSAAQELRKVEKLEQEIKTLADKIERLNETAWDVYEDALRQDGQLQNRPDADMMHKQTTSNKQEPISQGSSTNEMQSSSRSQLIGSKQLAGCSLLLLL